MEQTEVSRVLESTYQTGDPHHLHCVSLLASCVTHKGDLPSLFTSLVPGLERVLESRVAICEFDVSMDGKVDIKFQAASRGFAVICDEQMQRWFKMTLGARRHVQASPGNGWTGAIDVQDGFASVGLFALGEAIGFAKEEFLLRFVPVLSAQKRRMQQEDIQALQAERAVGNARNMTELLSASVDVAWLANSSGVIHCSHVFNGKTKEAKEWEGLSLVDGVKLPDGKNVWEALRSGKEIRCQPVERVDELDKKNTYILSARLDIKHNIPVCSGTLVITEKVKEPDNILLRLQDAKHREDKLRREEYAIMEGLRFLFGNTSSNERLPRMVDIICSALKADEGQIVKLNFKGEPERIVPGNTTLPFIAREVVQHIADDLAQAVVRIYSADGKMGDLIREALGLRGKFIATTAIPTASGPAFLVCVTQDPEGFGMAELESVERFTILLRQALQIRDEQIQMVHTTTLAAVGQMAASVAHELKQPLNTIGLAAQNLEMMVEINKYDEKQVRAKLERIFSQIERATNIIDSMRKVGRKTDGEKKDFSVRLMLEDVLAAMRPELARNGIEVHIDIGRELTLTADQLLVEQIMINLIRNAMDAMTGVGTENRKEERNLTIEAAALSEEAAHIVIRVSDTGPGFSEAARAKALDAFFTTKPVGQGTGLGLAICDTIARENGGYLEIGNHEKGAYVAMHLPQRPGALLRNASPKDASA